MPDPPAAFQDRRDRAEKGMNEGLTEDANGIFNAYPDVVQEEEGGIVSLVYQGATDEGGHKYDVRVTIGLDDAIPPLTEFKNGNRGQLVDRVEDLAWNMVHATHSVFLGALGAHEETAPGDPQVSGYVLRFTEDGSDHYAQHRLPDETVWELFRKGTRKQEVWEQEYQELLRDRENGLQIY